RNSHDREQQKCDGSRLKIAVNEKLSELHDKQCGDSSTSDEGPTSYCSKEEVPQKDAQENSKNCPGRAARHEVDSSRQAGGVSSSFERKGRHPQHAIGVESIHILAASKKQVHRVGRRDGCARNIEKWVDTANAVKHGQK